MRFTHIFKVITLCYITCSVQSAVTNEPPDMNLRCEYCSSVVGHTSQIFNKLSPGALKIENSYMFGKNVTIQTLVNPILMAFDVLTIRNANCVNMGRSFVGRTWFPAYGWRICACPRCTSQLGWTFEKELTNDTKGTTDENDKFHVLLLKALLGLNDNDDPTVEMMNFLRSPKSLARLFTLPQTVAPKVDDDSTVDKEDFEPSKTPVFNTDNVDPERNTVTATETPADKNTTIVFTNTTNRNDSEINQVTNKTITPSTP